MSEPRTAFAQPVTERTTRVYKTTLLDENGLPLQLVDVVTLKLTLYNLDATLALVNSRDHQDVKNANGGTLHATSGLFTFVLTPLDTAILTDGNGAEIRVGLLEAVYGGTKEMAHEFQFTVTNLGRRPAV